MSKGEGSAKARAEPEVLGPQQGAPSGSESRGPGGRVCFYFPPALLCPILAVHLCPCLQPDCLVCEVPEVRREPPGCLTGGAAACHLSHLSGPGSEVRAKGSDSLVCVP